MERSPCIYIMTNRKHGTLYVGVTSNLVQRAYQHKSPATGFVGHYRLQRLVYFEAFATMEAAIQREKRLKRWRREWKIDLIETDNSEWRDLWPDIQ